MKFSMRNITVLALAGILPCLSLEAQPSWAALFSSGIARFKTEYNKPMNNQQGTSNSSPYLTRGNVAVASVVGLGSVSFLGYMWQRAKQHRNKSTTVVEQQYYFGNNLHLNLRDNASLLEEEIKNLTEELRQVCIEVECHTHGNSDHNKEKRQNLIARLQGLKQLKVSLL